MDFPGRVIAAVLAIVLIVLFPLQYLSQSSDSIISSRVNERTRELTDAMRDKGYIDKSMYEQYVEELDTTGDIYNIEIQDIHPVAESSLNAETDSGYLNVSYMNGKQKGIIKTGNKKTADLDTCSLLNTNISKNQSTSPVETQDEIQSFATHVHTADCYAGHIHDDTCKKGWRCDCANPRLYWDTNRHSHSFVIYCGSCGQDIVAYDTGWNSGVSTWVISAKRYHPSSLGCGYYEPLLNGKRYAQLTEIGTWVEDRYYDRPPSDTGDIRVKQACNTMATWTGAGMPQTYDQLYAALPVLTDVKTYKNGFFAAGMTTLPIYNCAERECQGNTLTLLKENDIRVYLGSCPYYSYSQPNDMHVFFNVQTYKCSSCGKELSYISLYYSIYPVSTGYDPSKVSNFGYTVMAEGENSGVIVNQFIQNFITSRNTDFVTKIAGYAATPPSYVMEYYKDFRSSVNSCGLSVYDISESQYVHYLYTLNYKGYLTTSNPIPHYLPVEKNFIPMCDKVVTSITPTNPIQSIKKGESIITTATATYLDGHLGIVNCTSNFNPNQEGTQTVTLTYTGLVGNAKTIGTRTCTMSVTLITKTLESITATPAEQIIRKQGTPTFTVKAKYTDNSVVELTPDKYTVSAFDASIPGEKTVTISYTEGTITKSATVKVYVDDLKSIIASPAIMTVEKYTEQTKLNFAVVAHYIFSSDKTISGGYSISGYSPDVMGEQTVTISYAENGTTRTVQARINVTGLHKTCNKCGNIYELKDDDTDPGCPVCKNTIVEISVTPDYVEVEQGHELPITVLATYADGSSNIISGWTSNFVPDRVGMQKVTVEYGGFVDEVSLWVSEAMITCPICQTRYPVSEGKCPVCSETVVGITVTPAVITVHRYDNIDLTVRAEFADHSSRPVTEWSIDKTTTEEGTFTATVSYENATATIALTVLPLTTITCPNCGLLYDSGEYPNGCPVCSTTITGIEAYLTGGGELVQYGSTPGIVIVEIYQDTHREVTYDGYTIEGYQPYTLGEQTLTIKYGTFSTTIDIEVINTLNSVTCPNGHVYFLNEDGSDPGCPYCKSSEELGEDVYFYDITYTDEILDAVYNDGIYKFDKMNYVTLCVTKKDKSLITRVQKTFFQTAMLGRKKRYIYGGKVC